MRQTQNASKKDNRKSILVIGLLLLLVAVIGFGGYTLSKYVTKKSVKDNNAQVAKWGFTVTADTENLFNKNYKAGVKAADDAEAANLDVKASGNYNVVAPGLSGSMTFKIEGTAEVRAKLAIAMSEDKDIKLSYKKDSVAGEDYYPVKWTLTKTGATGNVAQGKLSDVKAALAGLYEDEIAPNAGINDEYTLSWAWEFEVDADKNALDSVLAQVANKADLTEYDFDGVKYTEIKASTEVAFNLSISIVQVKSA